MTGIRFQSWEHFLYYVQNREGIAPGAGRSNVSYAGEYFFDSWKLYDNF